MEALTSRQAGLAVRRPAWGKEVRNPHSIPAVQEKNHFPKLGVSAPIAPGCQRTAGALWGTGAVSSAMSRSWGGFKAGLLSLQAFLCHKTGGFGSILLFSLGFLNYKPGTSSSSHLQGFQFPFTEASRPRSSRANSLSTGTGTTLPGKVGVNLTLGIAGTIGLEGAFWFIRLVLCC